MQNGHFVVGTITCNREAPVIQRVFTTLEQAKAFCEQLKAKEDNDIYGPADDPPYADGEYIQFYSMATGEYRALIADEILHEHYTTGCNHRVNFVIVFADGFNLTAAWKTLTELNI